MSEGKTILRVKEYPDGVLKVIVHDREKVLDVVHWLAQQTELTETFYVLWRNEVDYENRRTN